MIADDLTHTELASVVGLLFAAGLKQGFAFTEWSETQGATKAEAAVQVSAGTAENENPGFALGPGGHWFVALTQDDKVRIYRSKQHCAVGAWDFYQAVE